MRFDNLTKYRLSCNQNVNKLLSAPGMIDVATHEFTTPVREVLKPEQMPAWESSQAYRDLVGFIIAMNEAVKNKSLNDECHISQLTTNLLDMLNTISSWIDEIPPVDQPQRFGNKAFKDVYSRLQEKGESIVKAALDEQYQRAAPEIYMYLVESIGNSTRIDYGSGHELSFIAFLCCLFKIGAYTQEDSVAAVNKVFQRYIEVMRKMQQTYNMEPAGSHGVWSLDDYQFVPFLWGSSQLLDHKRIHPKSFPKPEVYEYFAKDYMFLGCVKFINQVKTGPFAEHSNQLWNISGVPHWHKVNSGLVKMYKAEVLAKFPVVQHFLFGSILSIKPA
ncbi:serine/threonine-protein phosphatase 2A activator-like isoform X1 [Lingula anatina]|uniref:Serine/threonine-protein phosphatase 2A activator n=1 Tax=Lingula anatina TaxID=7574 RepID=A0A1S3K0I4_LINAN|nr:serine/threonine-protein phosphatase 2A activator-like isoform X1 [Lingula anatina]|eukprot:XP_013415791.1 serine/threonine-protein phosphatase 2A activator-like isoform X1 [Lingula anatina]